MWEVRILPLDPMPLSPQCLQLVPPVKGTKFDNAGGRGHPLCPGVTDLGRAWAPVLHPVLWETRPLLRLWED